MDSGLFPNPYYEIQYFTDIVPKNMGFLISLDPRICPPFYGNCVSSYSHTKVTNTHSQETGAPQNGATMRKTCSACPDSLKWKFVIGEKNVLFNEKTVYM